MTAVIGPAELADAVPDAADAVDAADGSDDGPGGSIDSADRIPAPLAACTPASVLPVEPTLRAEPSGRASDGGCDPADGSISAAALRGVAPAAAVVAEPDADAAARRLESAGDAPPRVEGDSVSEKAPLLSDSAPTCGERVATGAARDRPACPGDKGFVPAVVRVMTELPPPLRGLRGVLSSPPPTPPTPTAPAPAVAPAVAPAPAAAEVLSGLMGLPCGGNGPIEPSDALSAGGLGCGCDAALVDDAAGGLGCRDAEAGTVSEAGAAACGEPAGGAAPPADADAVADAALELASGAVTLPLRDAGAEVPLAADPLPPNPSQPSTISRLRRRGCASVAAAPAPAPAPVEASGAAADAVDSTDAFPSAAAAPGALSALMASLDSELASRADGAVPAAAALARSAAVAATALLSAAAEPSVEAAAATAAAVSSRAAVSHSENRAYMAARRDWHSALRSKETARGREFSLRVAAAPAPAPAPPSVAVVELTGGRLDSSPHAAATAAKERSYGTAAATAEAPAALRAAASSVTAGLGAARRSLRPRLGSASAPAPAVLPEPVESATAESDGACVSVPPADAPTRPMVLPDALRGRAITGSCDAAKPTKPADAPNEPRRERTDDGAAGTSAAAAAPALSAGNTAAAAAAAVGDAARLLAADAPEP